MYFFYLVFERSFGHIHEDFFMHLHVVVATIKRRILDIQSKAWPNFHDQILVI